MSKNKKNDGIILLWIAAAIFIVVALIAFIIINNYFDTFKSLPSLLPVKKITEISDPAAVWGQFGDYVGGIINPLVGIATVLLIIITIVLQRTELKNSIEELRNSNAAIALQNKQMAQQGFEQTFFSWLSSYRDLVSSISAQDTRQIGAIYINGRNALQFWSSEEQTRSKLITETKIYLDELHSNDLNFRNYELLSKIPDTQRERIGFSKEKKFSEQETAIIKKAVLTLWENVYTTSEIHIDSMFRTVYRLLRFIDEQPNEFLNADLKWHYVSIVRAQLSFIEMEFLFYNGFTNRGEKFNAYINKYALFDNFSAQNNIHIQILKNSSPNPYEPSAFSSELAKKNICERVTAT